jgi:hypothetical protein
MRPLFIRYADLTEREVEACDRAVRAADAVDNIVSLPTKQRIAVIVAAVRSMNSLTASEKTKVVRYFTVN